MTTIASCDHHDQAGLVPSNRSRARILEQLTLATSLGEAVVAAVTDERTRFIMREYGPGIVIPLTAWADLMRAWGDWFEAAPSGDDWAPPPPRPAEIKVPEEGADDGGES